MIGGCRKRMKRPGPAGSFFTKQGGYFIIIAFPSEPICQKQQKQGQPFLCGLSEPVTDRGGAFMNYEEAWFDGVKGEESRKNGIEE